MFWQLLIRIRLPPDMTTYSRTSVIRVPKGQAKCPYKRGVRIRGTMITSLLRPQCSVSKIKPKLSVLLICESKLINVIVLLSYMVYIRILEQNEILRLRHVLVLLSLTDSVNVCVTADRKWYIYRKLSTPCPGVSAIKRLSLYEFAPNGREFVSVVRITEGPYYRDFF